MRVTLVMYHYVRDLRRSRYPGIKGLTIDAFRGQLAYLRKHYNFVSGAEVIAAIADGHRLAPRAALLTFDDGYIDHFANVFPILDREQIPACFFPPAASVLEGRILDVNKIHFVLASG